MEGQAEGGESAAGPATPPCREGLPARPVPRVPGLQLAVEHQGRKEGFLKGSTVWPQDAPPFTSPSSHAHYQATSSDLKPAGLSSNPSLTTCSRVTRGKSLSLSGPLFRWAQ